MPDKKPTYNDLLKENISLKLELSANADSYRLIEDMRLKNAMLEEMNEELTQTFDQLKRNREALEKIDQLYRLLAENITDVIWIIDLDGRFIYVSPSAYKLYGYTPDEAAHFTVKDVLTKESYEKHKIVFSRRMERELKGEFTEPNTYIWKQKKKNGEIIWTEVNASPLRDENNRFYALVGVTRDITGRKLAEDRMNKLTVAVEQSPASIVITSLDGSIEYVNSTFTQTTGYSQEEVLGKDPKILKSGQTPKSTYRKLWKTILSRKVWQGEFVNKDKFGEIYWEQATIAPIMDSEGQITNFVAIKNNITSQKFHQEDLKKSQERYQLLSDISLEGIMIYENRIIQDINKSLSNITGFSSEELIGLDPIDKLFTSESEELINDKILDNYDFPFEVEGIRKNGDFYPAEMEIRQLKYKGRDLKILALRDLSYRKRVEDVLRSSLKLTEMLAKNTENEIINQGLEEAVRLSESKIGFFHFVNEDQTTINMFTWSKKTLENCSIPDIAKDYPISDAGTWIDSFHERRPVIHNDYKALNHKKGLPEGHFPLVRYISLPVIEGDKVKIIFGVGNKKQNYNQFDVDILSLFAKTIWMVVQRKRIEQKLSEANETKAKFLSVISHDLRSPIGSITSLTDMILENIEILTNEELIKFIAVLNQTSKTTYDQLENMLIWSRAQNDRLEFAPVAIEFNTFLNLQLNFLQYLIEKKKIELKLNLGTETKVFADQNMLGSILRNLLSNAIKFTPQKGTVSIESRIVDKVIEVKICDAGLGIEPKRLKHIFSLSKGSSTFGTENEKGSGLGLLLCKEFVSKNGGEIWVESEWGKGSQFYFTLPIAIEG